ncbi:MAG: hypothetical protein DMD96_03155 [Candidatus Rokuibacteriota bacterium]|nr:MAG: hypothetical protein DMD96_03155 [Candidatus Rokubacteria bacterium]
MPGSNPRANASPPTEGGSDAETILVIDDQDRVRVVVREMLQMKGYTVLDTGDPQEALQLTEKHAIRLLLADVVMPVMTGTELARRVQAISPQTRVLLMSGSTVFDAAASGYPFIAKPFTPDALAARVRQVLT